MSNEGAAKIIARWVALGALFLIPLTPLLVANSYFFPFITGKAFYFRILVEIAVTAWVMLAFLDKNYRPRVSAIGIAVLGFVAWMFVADAFAINAAKAFWSNFERMEGWVLLAHLLGLFFASSAVLRAEKKWRAWFLTSIVVSMYISGHALFQLAGWAPIHQGSTRIDASFGNSAYLAIYLLFNVFIAIWLAFTEKYAFLKWSLIALAILESILIFFTETRGTIVGLVVGLALAAFLTMFTAGKRARGYATAAFIGMVLLVGGFALARNSDFVQNNHVLQRVASITWNDLKVRRTIWHMAFQGALEKPILGWGQEGFNYVFNKYYDPSLYRQEPWFDRAHNAFIDWLTAGGIPAFLLYISLFGSVIILLWRSSELSRPERIALTAALTGYAIHNVIVFDNLYSYIYFFAILALIDSQTARPIEMFEHAPELSDADGLISALPVAAIIGVALVWYVNVPGMRVATNLITAISPSKEGFVTNYTTFKDLTAHPAFAAQEIREQLISFATSAVRSDQVTDDQKQQIVTLAITEMQKQVAAYPLDARERLQLAYIYRSIGDGASALKQTELAQALSPKKEQILIEVGSINWDLGNTKAARDSFAAAYALGPEFPVLAEYVAAGAIADGDLTTADQVLDKAYGTTIVDSDILAVAYYRTKNWSRLTALWKMRAEKPDAPVASWFSFAAVQYTAGDIASAIATLNKAVALYPEAAPSVAAAIKEIEGK